MPEHTYTVEGTDRQSGVSTRLRLQAASPRLAAAQAKDRGVIVARVLQLDPATQDFTECDWSALAVASSQHDQAILAELVRIREFLAAMQEHRKAQKPPVHFWTIVWALIVAPLVAGGIALAVYIVFLILKGLFDAAVV